LKANCWQTPWHSGGTTPACGRDPGEKRRYADRSNSKAAAFDLLLLFHLLIQLFSCPCRCSLLMLLQALGKALLRARRRVKRLQLQ
jgi:hypothetical protein